MKMDFRLEEWVPPTEGAHLGIGIVGAGQVVNGAHLPAYRKGGLSVAGIFDRDRAKAEATAGRFGVEKVYGSLEELLDDPRVDIVDVAVPGVEQKRIALAAAGRGKHLLCQKPLAASVDDGREIVAAAKANGVQLAVNMNGRWDPALRAAKSLIEDEFMGAPRFVRFEVNGGGWPSTGWISAGRHMAILYNMIHCIDFLRYCFGEPERVSATDISFPEEKPPGDRMAIITMEFPEHLRGLVIQDCYSSASPARWFFQFEGTEGVIEGEPGWHEYPNPRPSTLRLASRRWDWTWATPKLAGCWLPDGWLGTMTALQQAVVTGRPAHHSGDDNLKTLELVFAIYDAIDQRRVVELGGVAGAGLRKIGRRVGNLIRW